VNVNDHAHGESPFFFGRHCHPERSDGSQLGQAGFFASLKNDWVIEPVILGRIARLSSGAQPANGSALLADSAINE
jgi:hypothetical protein